MEKDELNGGSVVGYRTLSWKAPSVGCEKVYPNWRGVLGFASELRPEVSLHIGV